MNIRPPHENNITFTIPSQRGFPNLSAHTQLGDGKDTPITSHGVGTTNKLSLHSTYSTSSRTVKKYSCDKLWINYRAQGLGDHGVIERILADSYVTVISLVDDYRT
jgi:hypothetical protein